MSEINHQGLFRHRLRGNPRERLLADRWESANGHGTGILKVLLDIEGRGAHITQRDATVAATVIQWLGSPVGQQFARLAMEEKDTPA